MIVYGGSDGEEGSYLMRPRLLLATVLLLASATAGEPRLRILFVGNSLTAANDLPSMVQRIGEVDGRRIEVRSLVAPNYALADHLASPDLARTLQRGWDVVVLQQGPSSLPESREALRRDARAFAGMTPDGARIALLMAWPPRGRAAHWDAVSESYRLAAEDVGGILIPAGEALRHVDPESSIEVFAADAFHPSPAGTYLAALTVYRTLTGRLPDACARAGVAERIAGRGLGLTAGQLRSLVRAAGTDGAP